MASVKDVAKLAGVSPITVSRVFTGKIVVEASTRQKVLDAASELNYRPNLIARGLRNRSGRLIGLMVPEIMNETFAAYISNIEESCVKRGFTMILGNSHENPETEQHVLRNFIGMNVDGIIVSQVSDSSAVMNAIVSARIPVVAIDRALEDNRFDEVLLANRLAGELVAEYLWSQGHRKVVCIGGPESISLSRERLDGFRSFFAAKGLPIVSFSCRDFEFESGIACVNDLESRSVEFTGIWAQNDTLALGAMVALGRFGRRIPDDVSIVGMDDTRTAHMVTPALTTVRQLYQEISEAAVDLLLNRIRNPGSPLQRIVIEPQLILRDSVKQI